MQQQVPIHLGESKCAPLALLYILYILCVFACTTATICLTCREHIMNTNTCTICLASKFDNKLLTHLKSVEILHSAKQRK